MCCAVINLTFLLHCCYFAMRLTWKLFLLTTVWIGRSIVGWLSSLRISIWIHLLHSLLVQLRLLSTSHITRRSTLINVKKNWDQQLSFHSWLYCWCRFFLPTAALLPRLFGKKISNFWVRDAKYFERKENFLG